MALNGGPYAVNDRERPWKKIWSLTALIAAWRRPAGLSVLLILQRYGGVIVAGGRIAEGTASVTVACQV